MTKDKAFAAALPLAEDDDLSGALRQLHRDLGFNAPPGEAERWQEHYVNAHWEDGEIPDYLVTFARYVDEMEGQGYSPSVSV